MTVPYLALFILVNADTSATISWIQYEKAAYVPSNFVAIGDSVMQVNPTFGYVLIYIFCEIFPFS